MSVPIIECKVVNRGSSVEYKTAIEQYATRSVVSDGLMTPAMVIYAKNDRDVCQTIRYAKYNKIAVSVRTGGHQYCGVSSTSGRNIQLDLSTTYREFDITQLDDDLVTCGISLSLGEFVEKCADMNCFTPHGVCSTVRLGGHAQTGGFGMLMSSFGLLGDCIVSFTIIGADACKQVVTKKTNSDLFYAVLGCGPGNFGVLTHITVKVFRDYDANGVENYPYSRGLTAVYWYDRQHEQSLTDLVVKMNADSTLPGDFTMMVATIDGYNVLSDYMHYGCCFQNKKQDLFAPSVILVSCCWGNVSGYREQYNDKWFDAVKRASPTYTRLVDVRRIPLEMIPSSSSYGGLFIDDTQHTRMSILSKKMVFLRDSREYNAEYDMRTYMSKETTSLLRNTFLDRWHQNIANMRDVCQKNNVKVFIDLFVNGRNNQLQRNVRNGTSYSWRDTCIGVGVKLFYYKSNALDMLVSRIHAENDNVFVGKHGAFDREDRRSLSFSYTRPEESGSLDLMWSNYFDSRKKYKKALRIKQKYDPEKIFSPNLFCVGGMR
jgi:hypothetical protein